MIATLLRVNWTNLKRDRVAQALTYVLPIVFFSIFALVFGGQANNATPRVRVAIVDEDHSDLSARIVKGLLQEQALRGRTTIDAEGAGASLDRVSAERLVKDGDVPVAVVLPRGLGAAGLAFDAGSGPHVQLLADASEPVALQMVRGLLQKVTMTAAPDLLMAGGMAQFERYAGELTPVQRRSVDTWLGRLKREAARPPGAASIAANAFGMGIDTVDVLRAGQQSSLIAFFAAGIGVMFLLFSCAGASGTLLDEVESGTFDRLLSTRLGMRGVLAGKWLYLSLLGASQLTLMFLWGRLAFGLDLFHHVPGFVVMTVATAAAAAGFGLVLATMARTRAQLSGMATIIILVMSALGGSMFPRFLMSDTMQTLGLATFNAWALDGYVKVFWRDVPVWQLWPQVGVLAALTCVFLALARWFARRWETA